MTIYKNYNSYICFYPYKHHKLINRTRTIIDISNMEKADRFRTSFIMPVYRKMWLQQVKKIKLIERLAKNDNL